MTAEDVQKALELARQARAKADAATPGPWEWSGRSETEDEDGVFIHHPQGSFLGNTLITLADIYEDDHLALDFIASAPTDVRSLCDAVEALVAEVGLLRGAIAASETNDRAALEQHGLLERFGAWTDTALVEEMASELAARHESEPEDPPGVHRLDWRDRAERAEEDLFHARRQVEALCRDIEALSAIEQRYDALLTRVRNALGAAGVPDHESYPADELATMDEWDRSLHVAGRMISPEDRVARLAADRDAALRAGAEACRALAALPTPEQVAERLQRAFARCTIEWTSSRPDPELNFVSAVREAMQGE